MGLAPLGPCARGRTHVRDRLDGRNQHLVLERSEHERGVGDVVADEAGEVVDAPLLEVRERDAEHRHDVARRIDGQPLHLLVELLLDCPLELRAQVLRVDVDDPVQHPREENHAAVARHVARRAAG